MYNNILVSGSLAYDYIMTTDQSFGDAILPQRMSNLSVSFLASNREKYFGGTAGNIAYNLHLLLQKPLVLSSLGQDNHDYLRHFADLGLLTDLIKIDEKCETAAAYILSDPNHCQIAFFYPGAMNYGEKLIDLSGFKGSLMLVAPDNVAKMNIYMSQCREFGIEYIFDPGQNVGAFRQDELRNAISGAKLTISNDYEFELMKKKMDMSAAEVFNLCETFIVTMGENGSEIFVKDREVLRVEAFNVMQVVDTTGAGDAFRAGILAGFKQNWSLEFSARVGSLLAKIVIEKSGTQNHYISPDDIEEKLGKKVFAGRR